MKIEDNNLFDKESWDAGYKDFDFFVAGSGDPVRNFILDGIPKQVGSCFEIGCFPGRYLALLGENNWELNGIDQTDYLDNMIKWLKANDYKMGQFISDDFTVAEAQEKFDLVYSCGFIEHFLNWEEIILKHISFVKEGGCLIITTPNFTGIQGALHRFVDKENYLKHNPKSMNPKKWKHLLEKNGFQVKRSGYFGKFDFWVGWQSRTYIQRFFLYRFLKIVPFLKKIIRFDSRGLSPFCGIVALKKPSKL